MTVYEVSMWQLPEFACKDAQGNFFQIWNATGLLYSSTAEQNMAGDEVSYY